MASLNKKVNDQGKKDRIPRKVGISERVASAIVNRRKALLKKLGIGNHSCSQPGQSPPERRQDASPQQIQSKQMESHMMRRAPVPFRVPIQNLTMKKDLCATPGCQGVRFKNTDLCRACKEDKKGSTERPRDTPVVRGEPQRQPPNPFQEPPRKCKCDHSAAFHDFLYCLECVEDIEPQYQMSPGSNRNMSNHFVNIFAEDMIPRKVDSSERVRSDIVNRREALLKKLGMDDRSRSPPECRQDAPPQQMQCAFRVPVLTVKKDLCATPGCQGVRLKNTDLCRTCKEDKKGSIEKSRDTPVEGFFVTCEVSVAPPDFNYCLESCLEDIEPQYQMSSGSRLPMVTTPVEHLDQQLRGSYVGPDKSDSSTTYTTPPEEFPPQYKRSKCQRPGGCPDGMFGDPAKKNLCSKCWKSVGEVMPATQRAPSADQGKYDTTYAGRA